MFSSRSVIVCGLTFRFSIHFEFIVYGVRKCSSFILLQVVDQFFPAPLVKEIVFPALYNLASFVKDKVSIGAWIYLWALYKAPKSCTLTNTVLVSAPEFVRYIYTLDR